VTYEGIVGRAGDDAFLDGSRGLVKCRVLGVTADRVRVQVDWGSCSHPLQLGRSPYGSGTTEEEYTHSMVVPKPALKRTRGSPFPNIAPYRWEVS